MSRLGSSFGALLMAVSLAVGSLGCEAGGFDRFEFLIEGKATFVDGTSVPPQDISYTVATQGHGKIEREFVGDAPGCDPDLSDGCEPFCCYWHLDACKADGVIQGEVSGTTRIDSGGSYAALISLLDSSWSSTSCSAAKDPLGRVHPMELTPASLDVMVVRVDAALTVSQEVCETYCTSWSRSECSNLAFVSSGSVVSQSNCMAEHMETCGPRCHAAKKVVASYSIYSNQLQEAISSGSSDSVRIDLKFTELQ